MNFPPWFPWCFHPCQIWQLWSSSLLPLWHPFPKMSCQHPFPKMSCQHPFPKMSCQHSFPKMSSSILFQRCLASILSQRWAGRSTAWLGALFAELSLASGLGAGAVGVVGVFLLSFLVLFQRLCLELLQPFSGFLGCLFQSIHMIFHSLFSIWLLYLQFFPLEVFSLGPSICMCCSRPWRLPLAIAAFIAPLVGFVCHGCGFPKPSFPKPGFSKPKTLLPPTWTYKGDVRVEVESVKSVVCENWSLWKVECVKNHTCGWTVFLTCVGDMVVCNLALAEKQLQVEDSGEVLQNRKGWWKPTLKHRCMCVCVCIYIYIYTLKYTCIYW